MQQISSLIQIRHVFASPSNSQSPNKQLVKNTSLQSYFTQYLFFHDNIDMITSGQNEILCLRLIIPVAGLNFEVQFEYEGRNELDKLTYEVMVLV
jgi:hypothetical protein